MVMQLGPPLTFQGHELYCDNDYSSLVLFVDLCQHGIVATGTFCTNRRGLPNEVVFLKDAFSKVPRGTGYYIWDEKTVIVYCVWKDTRVYSVCNVDVTQATKVRRWYQGIALVQMVSEQP